MWRATATQMAKLRFNRWGFHTYPFGNAGAEPAVWVGLNTSLAPGGAKKDEATPAKP